MIFRRPKRDQPEAQPEAQPKAQPDKSTSQPQIASRFSSWWFWLPLLFQTGLILAVPAQDAYTYATGRTVTLQTAPVDPYDLLRGYSQTLGYEISNAAQLKKLPGGELVSNYSSDFYLVLEAPTATTQPPQPWKPTKLSPTQPENLSTNQVVLQGKVNRYGQITYGLETYYMPEDQRQQINAEISSIQQSQPQAFVVEVKVDSAGNSVPTSLWVKDQNYRF